MILRLALPCSGIIRDSVKQWVTALLTLLSITSTAKAGEGFYETRPSLSGVSRAWDATFLIAMSSESNHYMGSSALIGVHHQGQTYNLYFLTAFHVIKNNCKLNAKCKDTLLLPTANVPMSSEGLESLSTQASHAMKDVVLVKFDESFDLALLRVQTPLGIAPAPIPMVDSCSDLSGIQTYTIGFPWVSARVSPNSKAINHRTILLKRWSAGLLVGPLSKTPRGNYLLNEDESNKVPFVALTADALSGNSGGPIVDEEGRLVSIQKAITAQESTGYQFDSEWNEIGVRCEILRAFVAD
jgi:S1-C subfamily serine protease